MTPSALFHFVLQQRGLIGAVELPVELLFDDRHRVSFSEAAPGLIAFECRLDSLVSGDDATLRKKLLQWNRLGAMAGSGAFALDPDGQAILYRVALPSALLDPESFKALVHEFLLRVDQLNDALLDDPLAASAFFAESAPATNSAPEGMISV